MSDRLSSARFGPEDARRIQLGRRTGFAANAVAFAAVMLGTTLPTPLYGLYGQRFGFSELMITVIFATYAGGVMLALLLFGRLQTRLDEDGCCFRVSRSRRSAQSPS